ncbi:MAG: SUMF1/EgtB/PvdO family nonheme iron enzyme [Desulfovibrionaceae bacterium]|nr:SUMF1/EgtB/PvdO family nonheme iron enzyme [Desulfovibrionaceae bacterium]
MLDSRRAPCRGNACLSVLCRALALLLVSLLVFIPESGFAAIGKKRSLDDPSQLCNPNADAADIVLPMPNGLSMVVRAISIPSSHPLSDKKFDMGVRKVAEERGFYEKRTESYISSSVTYADLPAAWQQKLPSDEKTGYCYYFLGKYELTNAQWHAVMGGESKERGDLPKANVSWYDIQAFLHKYNDWLLAQNPPVVPIIEGCPMYFRLPTEAEWEYAARGGNLPQENQGESDFVKDDNKRVEDYAVFGERYDKPVPVGSMTPNPLGLYDMGGNVAEFVQDGFRYTIVESLPGGGRHRRLHGSEGGFIAKGGSFLSASEQEVYPGKRVEMRMFTQQKDGSYSAHKARFLGFRLVLTSINIPGTRKSKELLLTEKEMSKGKTYKEEKVAPVETVVPKRAAVTKDQLVSIKPGGDPLTELEKIYAAAASPFMKSNLEQFKDLLADMNLSLAQEREENLRSNIRSSAYKADAFENIAFRFYELSSRVEKVKRDMPQGLPRDKAGELLDIIMQHYRSLERSTNLYRLAVRDIAQFPKSVVAQNSLQVKKEYQGKDKLDENIRKNIDMFSRHVEFVRAKGFESLTNEMVWRESLPENIRAMIEKRKRQGFRSL